VGSTRHTQVADRLTGGSVPAVTFDTLPPRGGPFVRARIIGIGFVGVLAGVLTLAGGCGGGSGRLSAREYVSETSAVCAHANRAIARITGPHLELAVEVSSTTGRIVAIHRDSVDSLRRLRPPKDYEGMAKLWIALVDQSVDELDAMRTSLRAGDSNAAFEYAQKASVLDARSREIARKQGITPCKVPELVR
jgi:hypothetical protein